MTDLAKWDIDYEKLFKLTARPGETFGDDWINWVGDQLNQSDTTEATLVESESYDDDFPATEDTEIWLFRGVYVAVADSFRGGPFMTHEEARDFAEIGYKADD